jgi:benzodiazapine receptor
LRDISPEGSQSMLETRLDGDHSLRFFSIISIINASAIKPDLVFDTKNFICQQQQMKSGEIKMATNNSSLLRWANIIAFVLTVIINGLAGSTTLIGGVNTAFISDSNPTLITPAGFTFAIWGVIYILLSVFVIYQALPSQKEKEYHKKISWLFILISITNISWIFLWQHNLLTPSLPVIVLFLMGLILIYTRLGIGKTQVPLREKLAIHTPFSVYLGWVTIATIANVAVAAVSVNWDGFGINPETWAILIIIIALLLTLIVTATRKEIAYGLVIIWALIGIISKQTNTNIITTAEASVIIILIAIAATAILTKLKK